MVRDGEVLKAYNTYLQSLGAQPNEWQLFANWLYAHKPDLAKRMLEIACARHMYLIRNDRNGTSQVMF